MLILEPVIETFGTRHFSCWPVADPSDGFVRLSAEMTAAEIGVAVAALVPHEVADDLPQDPVKLLRGIIGAQDLIAPGGLRARDAGTGVSIAPSCCCGLETWRDWVSVLDGGQPWLGHSPAPWVEHVDDGVRIWSGGGLGDDDDAQPREQIAVPLDALSTALDRAHLNLFGFLSAVGRWAQALSPDTAGELEAKLDSSLQITGRLSA
ncbi:hypothetical protein SAMN05192558_12038 [Actinokineospora alba]|uniref:Uncharacterized protein n=1 Tax=Actinokineospora alba TaxID=504798 RepID=A0A1H0WE12_9PSEU|nr:hypothetical protein [Actinokineospora alba]TDP68893.1 hypothetical protein C8E96_4460 [Actinokineospora alba]SDI74385.1 hypothetical protein SAMN05421871_107163 [Actinokineospora alba]SDP88907.1 hypothetical protein SAMN05192558_12038 [Actinokineospora alba]